MKVQPALIIVAALAAASVSAQTPAPAPQPTPGPRPAPAAEPPPTPPADYTYTADGRRDPFVSLVNRGDTADAAGSKRPEGVAGLLVNEIVVRGIVQSAGAWVAMVGAPDGKTYTVRTGDRLMDGRVRTITAQVLILMQEVKDPLSLEKQREVRKYLRGGEEVQ
jgi:Tfp pilus assembly protein PilP